MKRFFVFLIRFYQKKISPLKSKPSCRFFPTCSQYALEAVEGYGAFIGIILAIGRILRCNPLFKGGIDPVPESIFKGKIKKHRTKPTDLAEGK